jgi:hypothetical protein
MFGLRNRKTVSSEIDAATAEINRLIARVAELRKEENVAGKLVEIQAILDSQPIGGMTQDGESAEPTRVLQEYLGREGVTLWDCMEVRETYSHLRASLKVREKNVSLPEFGEQSLTHMQVMRQVYASKVLRELLRYKNDDIGKFVVIDQHGYVSLLQS